MTMLKRSHDKGLSCVKPRTLPKVSERSIPTLTELQVLLLTLRQKHDPLWGFRMQPCIYKCQFEIMSGYPFRGLKMELEFDICRRCLFFSVESLILSKMDRLTMTQRIQIIKIYYKNGNSATATYRAF